MSRSKTCGTCLYAGPPSYGKVQCKYVMIHAGKIVKMQLPFWAVPCGGREVPGNAKGCGCYKPHPGAEEE